MEKLIALLNENNQAFDIKFQGNGAVSLEITKTNDKTYNVIRTILHEDAVEDAGICGGGFEVYDLKDGTKFAVAWMDNDSAKIYLGKMGVAF